MPQRLDPRAPTRSSLGLLLAGLVMLGVPSCRSDAPSTTPSTTTDTEAAYVPYVQRRAEHSTQLTRDAPSTGRYKPGLVPEGAVEVQYPSPSTEEPLLAWLFMPPSTEGPVPGLVYFHGAFALGPKDATAIRPFVDAGYAVLTPALRGENGNPGRLELLYGEVDDAVSAANWLAERPEVDPDHIYAIGHSVGGGLAAMVALRPDSPVRLSGSVVGLYVPDTFKRWSRSKTNAELVRFDPFDPDEGTLRTLGPNVRDLTHRHHAYVGEQDTAFHGNAEAIAAEAKRHGAPLTVTMVPGDHMECLTPALADFLTVIEADRAGD